MKELWVEKYRPTSVKDYVFRDDKQKKQVSSGRKRCYSTLTFLRCGWHG